MSSLYPKQHFVHYDDLNKTKLNNNYRLMKLMRLQAAVRSLKSIKNYFFFHFTKTTKIICQQEKKPNKQNSSTISI